LRSDWFAAAAITAVLAIPALLVILKGAAVSDPDIWWHLRTGQWMVDHHTWPRTDPYSYWAAGHSWAAYSWIFELLMLTLYRQWGLPGIVFYTAAAALLIAWALLRLLRRYLRPAEAAGLTALGMYLLYPMIWPRPGMLTIVFFILQLGFVLRARLDHDTSRGWWLPVLYLVWVNFHIQFIYGLFILVVAALEPFMRKLLGMTVDNRDWSTSRSLGKVFGICFLVTLINPYSISIYAVVWEYARQTKAFQYIIELQALDFRRVKDYVELLLAMATAFVMGWKRQVRPLLVILVIAATIAAFRAERDAWFLVAVSLAVIACSLSGETRSVSLPQQYKAFVAAAVSLILVAGGIFSHGSSPSNLASEMADALPVRACQFLEAGHYTGPLFNVLDWGGYLIWRLPQMQVAIDGRTNLYGDNYLSLMEDSWDGKPVWAFNKELDNAKVVLAPSALPLTSILENLPKYQVVYDDGFAVVLVAK
jgi:hypothetical protein